MVWPFRARRKEEPHFRELVPGGFVDVHCHVLPGVDDGARSEEEARRMLCGFEALGYARIAATPHFYHSSFATPGLAEMRAAVDALDAGGSGTLRIVSGAEIAFDDRFFSALEAGALPRLGEGNVYLVELASAPGSLPHGFDDAVFRLAAKGVTLVLAHAERIPDFQRSAQALESLRRAGALVQVDLASLAGKHGGTAERFGWRLVEDGLADVVGSDAHAPSDLALVERALSALNEMGTAELARLASSNPGSLLDGDVELVVRHD